MAAIRTQFTIEDGDASYNSESEVVALAKKASSSAAGLIWQKTIQALQVVRVGFGSPEFPDNQGYFDFVAADNNAEFIEGQISIWGNSPSGSRPIWYFETYSSQCHKLPWVTGTDALGYFVNDRRERCPMPLQGPDEDKPPLGEDMRLQLWFKPTKGTLANLDEIAVRLPVLIID